MTHELGDVIGNVTVVTAEGRRKQGDKQAVGPTYRALA